MVYSPLWKALQNAGMKKSDLIDLPGEGPRTVLYVINDHTGKSMTVNRAIKYAELLGCTVEELLPDFRKDEYI